MSTPGFMPLGRQQVLTEIQAYTGWVRLDLTDGLWLADYAKPVTIGDPDNSNHNTKFVVDDYNQITTSNVKHQTTGDITIDDSAKGIVLKSPNGHYWRGTISNAGAVTWADLGTSPP